ncbi:U-scoloptoxin(01)-Er1a-like [Penaeus chinensis]|uniref:U-scoloptoxin(01)-Er1a-like n=1 Tax=Penaeus chinensis TaxID=139456 RepID=UPI001FB6D9FC|nr:U-scoloptoxin(01)-Er1a-like [Penaeus chinensis]XP_047493375.1 U-scoloptoxin(01)-Er1a-like [Penaeus chinensis]
MMKVLLVLSALAVTAFGRMAGVLPGGFRINDGFSCDGRPYGFYSDVDNECKAYHVCEPVVDEDGQLVEMAHYTFLCGEKTIFDQEQLSCATPGEAYPCANAAAIYEETNHRLLIEAEHLTSP